MGEQLLDAVDRVVFYNGLYDLITEWIKWGDEEANMYLIKCPPNYLCDATKCTGGDIGQAQFLWMLAVIMYGDYGTSPRYGWIYKKNWEECKKFFDRICESEREAVDYAAD